MGSFRSEAAQGVLDSLDTLILTPQLGSDVDPQAGQGE